METRAFLLKKNVHGRLIVRRRENMFANRLLQLHLRRRCRGYGQMAGLKNDVLDRIVYSSVLQGKKAAQHWRNMREKSEKQKRVELKCDVVPVSLQYLDDCAEQDKPDEPQTSDEPEDRPHVLPYSIVSKVAADEAGKQTGDYEDHQELNYDRESRLGWISSTRLVLSFFL